MPPYFPPTLFHHQFLQGNISVGSPSTLIGCYLPITSPSLSPPFSPRPWLAHVLWMLSGKGFTRSLVHSSLGACTLNIHTLQRFVPLGNPSEDLCYVISYVCCFFDAFWFGGVLCILHWPALSYHKTIAAWHAGVHVAGGCCMADLWPQLYFTRLSHAFYFFLHRGNSLGNRAPPTTACT